MQVWSSSGLSAPDPTCFQQGRTMDDMFFIIQIDTTFRRLLIFSNNTFPVNDLLSSKLVTVCPLVHNP